MPPSILLVKTSSLGDVVHNLPVVSDLRAAFPDAVIDWIVEGAFDVIPKLHPEVRHVYPCALRRWRRSLLRRESRDEIHELKTHLAGTRYDAIIDTQGLLKSALVGRLAAGTHHGLDWRSSREPLGWLYERTWSVPWGQHAVQRNRRLASLALGYALPSALDYGIRAPGFPPAETDDDSPVDEQTPWGEHENRYAWAPEAPYAVLFHSTSNDAKCWPEPQWKKLIATLQGEGVAAILPWGNGEERERARRIAKGLPRAFVPPRLGLRTIAGLLGTARLCVGVDTGLTHLAAALGRPTVGIYVSTNPEATGVLAPGNGANVGSGDGAPPLGNVMAAIRSVW
ncbi:MAG: lipopolysaccharide heptosyltransferase I [Burkholderiales bacterium]